MGRTTTRAKTILGHTEAFEADSLAAWLCEQPARARWIAGRLLGSRRLNRRM